LIVVAPFLVGSVQPNQHLLEAGLKPDCEGSDFTGAGGAFGNGEIPEPMRGSDLSGGG